jgi:uncharacterized delta-60 repeat protein
VSARPSFLLALAVLCAGLLGPVAGAGAYGGVDRSFGAAGEVDLTVGWPPQGGFYAEDLAPGSGGETYVAGTAYVCAEMCQLRSILIRFRADGSRDWSFGGSGEVTVGESEGRTQLAVDRRGRILLLAPNQRSTLARLLPGGALDLSFGNEGSVACSCRGDALLLSVDRFSRPLVTAAVSLGESGDAKRRSTRILVKRFRPGGGPDPSFGGDGAVSATVPDAFTPTLALGLADGGVLLAGGAWSERGASYVVRVSRKGRISERFNARGRHALASLARADGSRIAIAGLVPRQGGAVDVYGSLGQAGAVVRLRSDGRLDRGFADAGMRSLATPVLQAVPAPGGPVFALVTSRFRTFALWFDRAGHRLNSFAGGRGVGLEAAEWGEAEIELRQGRRPVVLDFAVNFCRRFCPPQPRLIGFTAWAPR